MPVIGPGDAAELYTAQLFVMSVSNSFLYAIGLMPRAEQHTHAHTAAASKSTSTDAFLKL